MELVVKCSVDKPFIDTHINARYIGETNHYAVSIRVSTSSYKIVDRNHYRSISHSYYHAFYGNEAKLRFNILKQIIEKIMRGDRY